METQKQKADRVLLADFPAASPSPDVTADDPSQMEAAAAVAEFVTFDQYEEVQLKAARRRKWVTWIALGIAAIVTPIASLMVSGRFSTANLHSAPSAPSSAVIASSAVRKPPPTKLSPTERKSLDEAIARDLHSYVWNSLPPISHEEQLAQKAFASVTNANYRSDKTSYETIKNVVVPHYARFVEMATAIQPETAQLRLVHHLMLTSAKLNLMAYNQIAAGENDKDRLWRVGAAADLVEAQHRIQIYHTDLVELAKATQTKLP